MSTPDAAAGSTAAVFRNSLASALVPAVKYLLPALGGTTFLVGALAAPLFMVSCSEANVRIPWELAGQRGQAPLPQGGLVSPVEPATVAPFAPGIFSLNQIGSGQGAV